MTLFLTKVSAISAQNSYIKLDTKCRLLTARVPVVFLQVSMNVSKLLTQENISQKKKCNKYSTFNWVLFLSHFVI